MVQYLMTLLTTYGTAERLNLPTKADSMLDQVCDSKKVTDHHAIIPTMIAAKTDLSNLPAGEREIMLLIALQVLRAVCEPYRFCETTVVISCGGYLKHRLDTIEFAADSLRSAAFRSEAIKD